MVVSEGEGQGTEGQERVRGQVPEPPQKDGVMPSPQTPSVCNLRVMDSIFWILFKFVLFTVGVP